MRAWRRADRGNGGWFWSAYVLDIPSDPKVGTLLSLVSRVADQHDLNRQIGLFDHLVDCGMTSMAMVDLMLAVEAEFDVTIPQKDMTPANFQSVRSLAQMLSRLNVG